jgi:hypothetical protein
MSRKLSLGGRRALWGSGALIAVLTAGVLTDAPPAEAATATPAKTLTGMWLVDPADYKRHETLPLKPEIVAAQDAQRKAASAIQQTLSDRSRKCLPSGMPGMMVNEFAIEFLQTPGRVTIISEDSPLPRSIYLNEKAHTPDLEPSWNGHSIGRFEGKTLVVDTVNFNDRVGPVTGRGIHAPTTHLVERYYLKDPDTLVGEMTFEDPHYLTKPWTTTHTYHRIKGPAELWEYACEADAPGWSERYAGDPAAKLAPKAQ